MTWSNPPDGRPPIIPTSSLITPTLRQAEVYARLMSLHSPCSAMWAEFADYYKELADREIAKMKIMAEVGGKMIPFDYPEDSRMDVDKPIRGWITISTPDGKILGWFQMCYLIGILPPK